MASDTQFSMEPQPGASPGYRLTGLPTRLQSKGEAPVLVSGQVINIGDIPLDFTGAASDRIALGARLCPIADPQADPDPADDAAYETRGRVEELLLQPGEAAAFELDINPGALESGTYRVFVDLVVEGNFWFADLGAPGHEIELEHVGAEPPRYSLSFDMRGTQPRGDGSLDLAGMLTNAGEQEFAFDRMSIGARIYSHPDFVKVEDYRGIQPVLEPRGTVSQAVLAPGGRSRFRLGIPLSELAPGRYVAIVDLVVEQAFWFADRGQVPYRLDFIRRVSGARLVAAQDNAHLQAESEKVRQLDAIVADRALESWRDIERWMAGPPGGEAIGPDPWLPAEAAAVLNEEESLPGIEVPVTRLMMHLRAASRNEARWSLDGNRGALEFLKWYLLDAPREQRLPGRPVPDEVTDYLYAGAFEPWLLPWPLSRLSLSALSGAPPALAALTGSAFEDLAFWWIGDFAEARSLAEGAIPPELDEPLRAYPFLSSPEGIPESPFLLRFLGANPKCADRYDIASANDRVALALVLLTRFLGQEGFGEFLSSSLIGYFGAPVDAEAMPVTRLEYLLWSHAQENGGGPGGEPSPSAIRDWFRGEFHGSPDYLAYSSLPSDAAARDQTAPAPLLLLVGLTGGSAGLAVNLGMSVAAAEGLGLPHAVCDASTGYWRTERSVGSAVSLSDDVTLFHVNPELVPQAMLRSRSRRLAASYKVGYFTWEVDALPAAHHLALDLVDEIWVPTEFVRDTYARHTDRPVLVMGKGIALPPVSASAPQGYDISPECFTFLTVFDFDSGVERKNPLAAVRAFRLAFPRDQDVALIVKTNMASDSHWGDPRRQWRAVLQAASGDRRIKVVVENLPFAELIDLIRTAGCVVSAHRGEGFGYIPAYALLMGTPVIATDYSGTADFCDEETSYPVRWTPKPIQPGEFLYNVPSGNWAEIDIGHLAERMREVCEAPEEARRRAETGRARVSGRYSLQRYAERCRARLAELGLLV